VTISAGEGNDIVGLGVPAGMVDLGPGRDQVDAELHWAWEGRIPLRLFDQLVTNAPPKNREEEAAKARARAQARHAA